MTEFGLAAAVLAASLVSTYFFCLRPMRRGHCARSLSRGGGAASRDGAGTGRRDRPAP